MRSFVMLALVLVTASSARAVTLYQFTDVGRFSNNDTFAFDVNDAGQVAGWSFNSGSFGRAYRWQNGMMTELPPPSGLRSFAFAINAAGTVVGNWEPQPSPQILRASRWDGTAVTNLGGNNGSSTAYGLNDANVIVGKSNDVAAVWTGAAVQLVPVGGSFSAANDVNNSGLIVGGVNGGRAFTYDGTTVSQLPTLGGAEAVALHVNDSNAVVGWSLKLSRTEARVPLAKRCDFGTPPAGWTHLCDRRLGQRIGTGSRAGIRWVRQL